MRQGIINKTLVSIYESPNQFSQMTDEGLYGFTVTILEEYEEFFRIRTHYNYEGYVHKDGILVQEGLLDLWQEAQKAVVMHTFADILSLPKVQGVQLMGVVRGAIVSVLRQADTSGWVKIGLWDGRCGFVKEHFLGVYRKPEFKVLVSESVLREGVTKTAKLYLGTQYRWGGRSSIGIDCSGLCSMTYLLNGVIIYRDAKLMNGYGVHEIRLEDKKPGDLLYFSGHIGLYLGNQLYIHSTAYNGCDGVVFGSLDPNHIGYRADLAGSLYGVGSVF